MCNEWKHLLSLVENGMYISQNVLVVIELAEFRNETASIAVFKMSRQSIL